MDIRDTIAKVAVLIPCYNREDFIGATLDSAINQTYPNIEIVVVDDGCTDNSRSILDSYGDRIRILEHPGRINKGQSASINLAIHGTESKYVAILDSDDLWVPQKIEKQVDVLNRDADAGFVYVNGFAINERGEKLWELYPPDYVETNQPARVLLSCCVKSPSSWLFRRSILEAVGDFDESMRSAQDHDMLIRLAERTKFVYLKEPLFYYRKHSDSQSGKYARRRWEVGLRILDKACRRHNYSWGVRRRRLAVLYFRLGQCSLEERRYIEAGVRFFLAGMLDPGRAVRVIAGKENTYGLH